jgi:hypothetical protein
VRIVTRAIAAAEEQRYLVTLLAAPVARTELVAGVLVAAAVVVAAVLATLTLFTWRVAVLAGTDASLAVLGRGAANAWPLSMLFAGLAALAAGRLHRSAQVTAIAIGHSSACTSSTSSARWRTPSSPALRVCLQVLRLGDPGRHRPAGVRRRHAHRRRPGGQRRAPASQRDVLA